MSPSLKAPLAVLDQSILTIHSSNVCILICNSMAWAWLYLIVGSILRRFDLVLYETTEENVEATQDYFNGRPSTGLNLIRVKVFKRDQE